MILKLSEVHGSWVYIFPVSGIQLSATVHEEVVVERVTFVTVRRLARVRKRLGLPRRVSEIRNSFDFAPWLLEPNRVVAVVRLTGAPEDIDVPARRMVGEALVILSVSQLGYSKRRFGASPSLGHNRLVKSASHVCLETKRNKGIASATRTDKIGDLVIDRRWKNFQRKVFFWDLLKILNRETKTSKSWHSTLRRVAVLVGQGQTSNDLPYAFLQNMITIETLLTVQGDKYSDMLPERVEAFIGWIGYWDTRKYEERIREIYKKRCKYVHDGDTSAIEVADLLLTDDIVLNLLVNIVGHPALFDSKQAVIDFSNKVAAERTLGIVGPQSRVRPKTMRHLSRQYSGDDLAQV